MKIYNTYLFGEITFESIKAVIEALDDAMADETYTELHIRISSCGGLLYPSLALYDYIQASKKPVTIIATGACQSAAILILQGAKKRVATVNTTFMVHELESCIEKPPYADLLIETEQIQKENATFIDLSFDRSNLTEKDKLALIEKRSYFTAKTALSYSLIDEIV